MAGPNLNLIITPMLDMAFQLMAFFIMTYHPSALEGHIDGKLSLPPGGPPAIQNPANAFPDPELADMIRVAVRANPDGSLQRLELIRPEDADRASIIEAGDSLEQGLTQLKKQLTALRRTTGQIRLEGDPGLRHQHMMRVYDVCRQSGFDKIHFEAPKRH